MALATQTRLVAIHRGRLLNVKGLHMTTVVEVVDALSTDAMRSDLPAPTFEALRADNEQEQPSEGAPPKEGV